MKRTRAHRLAIARGQLEAIIRGSHDAISSRDAWELAQQVKAVQGALEEIRMQFLHDWLTRLAADAGVPQGHMERAERKMGLHALLKCILPPDALEGINPAVPLPQTGLTPTES